MICDLGGGETVQGSRLYKNFLTWMQVRQDLDGDEADQYGFEMGPGCS